MPRKIDKRSSITIGLSPVEKDHLQAVAADTGMSQYVLIKKAILAFNPNRQLDSKLDSIELKLNKLLEGK